MRVLIIDNHPAIVFGVSYYLQKNGMSVVGNAFSKDEALTFTYKDNYDVAIIDLALGDGSGIDVIRTTLKRRKVLFVAFSAYNSKESVAKFFEIGGSGFVSKTSSMENLVDAIKTVAAGNKYISPDIQYNTENMPFVRLSDRELEVISLLAEGYSSKQAADKLFVSINTIRTHKLRIYQKLNIHSVAELSSYFYKKLYNADSKA